MLIGEFLQSELDIEAFGCRALNPGSVGLQFPSAGLRIEADREYFSNAFLQAVIEDRCQDFDSPVQVPCHEVRRADEELFFAAGFEEAVHAGVFQEAADDGAHSNILGESSLSRPKAANAAHEKVDFHARL